MNISEIYNLLLAGKKLKLEFPSTEEAEKFRIKVHQLKLRQESQFLKLEMMESKDRQVFSFSVERKQKDLLDPEPELNGIESTIVVATLYFQDRPQNRSYKVVMVEDENGDS